MSLSRDECGAGSVPRKIAWEKPHVDVLIFRATANGGGPGTDSIGAAPLPPPGAAPPPPSPPPAPKGTMMCDGDIGVGTSGQNAPLVGGKSGTTADAYICDVAATRPFS
jgi:hypothetical protein